MIASCMEACEERSAGRKKEGMEYCSVHLLVSQVLLEVHNTHAYCAFFAGARVAIVAGEFEEYRQRFSERRRSQGICAM